MCPSVVHMFALAGPNRPQWIIFVSPTNVSLYRPDYRDLYCWMTVMPGE